MADAVTTNAVFTGTHRVIRHYTNLSDGTGESAVAKLDISTLTGPDGTAPTKADIERVEYNISGMTVHILWDHDTDDTALILGAGTGTLCFEPPLKDPASTGGTGDVLFTTIGHTANDSYSITIWFKLRD